MLLASVIIINVLLKSYVPTYYKMISIGLRQIPFFILGIYCGYLSKNNFFKTNHALLLLFLFVWIFSCITGKGLLIGMSEKLVFICILCMLFYLTERWRLIVKLRDFLSWFGRYSLELYIMHLLIYCFLGQEELFGNVNPIARCSIMIVAAIAICAPIHRFVDVVERQFFK